LTDFIIDVYYGMFEPDSKEARNARIRQAIKFYNEFPIPIIDSFVTTPASEHSHVVSIRGKIPNKTIDGEEVLVPTFDLKDVSKRLFDRFLDPVNETEREYEREYYAEDQW